jgi:hypothetical protein
MIPIIVLLVFHQNEQRLHGLERPPTVRHDTQDVVLDESAASSVFEGAVDDVGGDLEADIDDGGVEER